MDKIQQSASEDRRRIEVAMPCSKNMKISVALSPTALEMDSGTSDHVVSFQPTYRPYRVLTVPNHQRRQNPAYASTHEDRYDMTTSTALQRYLDMIITFGNRDRECWFLRIEEDRRFSDPKLLDSPPSMTSAPRRVTR